MNHGVIALKMKIPLDYQLELWNFAKIMLIGMIL